jgi:hypothetical protein
LSPIISFEEFIVFEDCDEPLSLGVLAISKLFGTAEMLAVLFQKRRSHWTRSVSLPKWKHLLT